jgi:hypothetical protein
MRTAVSAILALALVSPAGAATVTVHEADSDGRVFVDVVGKINTDDVNTFKKRRIEFIRSE